MNRISRRASTALLALALAQCATKVDDAKETGIDETFLDRSTDPCTDFYQFACGTWIAEHPVDMYPTSVFLEGSGRNSILLYKILDTDRNGSPYVPDQDAVLLGDFYDSCMTGRSAPAVPHAPLDTLMADISQATTPEGIAAAVASLHGSGVSSFFWLGSDVDPGKPSRNVVALYPAGWNLDPGYFSDSTMSVVLKYEEHINKIAGLYGVTIDSGAVVAIDAALAAAGLSREAQQNPHATYNLEPLDTFTASSTHFAWAKYLEATGLVVSEINVTDPGYFAKLDELLGSQPLPALQAYLTWQVLESYAFALGKPFVVEEAWFHSGVLYGGDETPASDSGACLGSTASVFGFQLSRPFVKILFDEAKKTSALAILASIRDTFRQEIEKSQWIDAPTRAEALQKLDKVDAKVGYPDVWPDPIASLDRSTPYLQWWLAVSQARRKKNLDSLGAAVDRKTWREAPIVANAFYDGRYNEIVFPAAVLQSPEVVVGRASAVNYGAIGSVMGHELTHGFDSKGRQYDGDGSLRDWWTPDVAAEFVRRSTCVDDQYSHYELLPGQAVDGGLTLGENIADLGGAKLAYAAYKSSGDNESFVGTFNADQQFFLAFAQLRCSHLRDALVTSYLRSDTHSPDKFRVNGVVSNLPEFGSAFHCPAGSPMAPATRCEVW